MNLIAPRGRRNPADFNLARRHDAVSRVHAAAARLRLQDVRLRSRRDGRSIAWGKLANAKNPDLSAFRKRGGKLLMTYGWADAILQPMMGVNYYERAVAKNGPKTHGVLPAVHGARHGALRRRRRSGSERCGDGGRSTGWRKGKAPDVDRREARWSTDRWHAAVRSARIRRWRATRATGSIDDAANFSCVAP